MAWLRWAVFGGLAGAGSVLAVVLAVLATPSRVAAALALDERFNLKERVTTTLMLSEAERAFARGPRPCRRRSVAYRIAARPRSLPAAYPLVGGTGAGLRPCPSVPGVLLQTRSPSRWDRDEPSAGGQSRRQGRDREGTAPCTKSP